MARSSGCSESMDPSSDNTTPDYLDLPLREFLELVASDSPAPGGGSVAAVAVALAAGFAGIAARLVEEGNPNLKGDAMTAVFLADAGVNASAALAEINLSSANVQDDRLGRAQELVD